MRNLINRLKKIHPLIYLALFLSTGWFYWFQWRPANIRKLCYRQAKTNAVDLYKSLVEIRPGEPSNQEKAEIENGTYLKSNLDGYYEECLHDQGLK